MKLIQKNIKGRGLILALMLVFSSLFTSSVFAWPEVDHMNMCGAAAKTVQAYGGNFKGWNARDQYVARRGAGYYFKSNCPGTKAQVKKVSYKKPVKKVAVKKVVRKTVKKRKVVRRLSKSTYNEKLDCARVDRLNGLGLVVRRTR